jgi:hypothetical protein
VKELVAIFLVFLLLSAGCVSEKTTEEKMATTTTLAASDADYAFENAEIPVLGENDTVEIGEMI